MAKKSASSEESNLVWEPPENWDGGHPRPYPFFVERLSDITPDGWDYVRQSSNYEWIIIAMRSEHAPDYE